MFLFIFTQRPKEHALSAGAARPYTVISARSTPLRAVVSGEAWGLAGGESEGRGGKRARVCFSC